MHLASWWKSSAWYAPGRFGGWGGNKSGSNLKYKNFKIPF